MRIKNFNSVVSVFLIVLMVFSTRETFAEITSRNTTRVVSPIQPSSKTPVIFEGGGGDAATPPTITFDSPLLPFYTNANSVNISGHANERFSYVRIGGTNATLTNNGYNFEFQNLPLLVDAENLFCEAADLNGNVRAGSVDVVRDTVAPQITLIEPQDQDIVNESPLSVFFHVSDLHMNPLAVLVDGIFASQDASGNYSASVSLGSEDGQYTFFITAWDRANNYINFPVTVMFDTTPTLTDDELLDELQARSVKYFMEKVFPASGFVLDNSDNVNMSSIAATGFGLAALTVMASRAGSSPEWSYSYEQARARAEQILDNLVAVQNSQAVQPDLYGISGFFYHFVDPNLHRLNNQIEVSIIDTAIVLAGALTTGNYFGGSVKEKAEQIFNNVDWSFFFNPQFNQFYTGWKPESGMNGVTFDRYSDEALLVSLLALRAEPGKREYEESLFNYPRYQGTYGSYTLVHSYYGSLFTYLMAHAFYDFETLGYDRPSGVLSNVTPVDWWQNSVLAAKANRLFCIDRADEFSSFGSQSWGLSATIRPDGSYFGDNGAMPADAGNGQAIYDGTMPTAFGIATVPFFKIEDGGTLSNNLAFQNARHYYDIFSSQLWDLYGFYASFNHLNQFSHAYLGIELGPLVLMIENYRSRLIWNVFMNDSQTQAPLLELFSYQSTALPSGNDYLRECEHWTNMSGGTLDFKPHASNGMCVGGGWGKFSSHYATYAVDLQASNNLVFKLRYASDVGGGWVNVFVDDELRGSFYAAQTCPVADTCGWDLFEWSNSVQIGSVSAGTHVFKLATQGTPYGLNIDVFRILDSTLSPPVIESISPPDGTGFVEQSYAVLTVNASDPDFDPIQYRFSVNGEIAQSWDSNPVFDLSPFTGQPGILIVTVEVRDGFGGISSLTSEYAVFRRPIPPPSFGGGGGGGGGTGGGGCEPSANSNGKEGDTKAYASVSANCYPTA